MSNSPCPQYRHHPKIIIFDRASVDFVHLGVLNDDGVFWVTRSKESLCFQVVKKLPKATDQRILSDELVVLENKASRANIPSRCAQGPSTGGSRRQGARDGVFDEQSPVERRQCS